MIDPQMNPSQAARKLAEKASEMFNASPGGVRKDLSPGDLLSLSRTFALVAIAESLERQENRIRP